MAVKILVTAIGQQIIADTKQIENKETSEVVGYWLSNPRVVVYNRIEGDEGNNVSVGFGTYCLVSDEQEFSIKSDHIVAILEARAEVVAKYEEIINVPPADDPGIASAENIEVTPEPSNNEPDSTDPLAVGSPADLLD